MNFFGVSVYSLTGLDLAEHGVTVCYFTGLNLAECGVILFSFTFLYLLEQDVNKSSLSRLSVHVDLGVHEFSFS